MRRPDWIRVLTIPLLLAGTLTAAQAQGKGKGADKKPDKAQAKPDKAQGRGVGASKQDQPGRTAKSRPTAAERGRPERAISPGRGNEVARGRSAPKANEIREFGGEVARRDFRAFAASNKHGQRLAGLAVARAAQRGVGDAFVITPLADRVRIFNPAGALLLDLDDNRELGVWKVVTERDREKSGSPSFCRSGAGHPVWGRQWCVDKGFGLGVDQDLRWARVLGLNNVVFRRPVTTELLPRDILLDVLGDIVFNRLAAQAITLGLVEPLGGRWIGEPVGPRVLLVSSGTRPIAEVVDVNRDDRADLLLVAVRP